MVGESRQAGELTGGVACLDASGFGLDLVDDTFDVVRSQPQPSGDWSRSEAERLVRAYFDGRAYLELEFRSVRQNPGEIKQSPGRAPFAHGAYRHMALSVADPNAARARVGQQHNPVCATVPELVQGPNGPISSFAGVFAQHEGDYVFVNVLAATSPDLVVKAVRRVCHQKFGSIGVAAEDGDGTRVNGVVECISKVASDGSYFQANLGRNIDGVLDIEKVLACFTVLLGAEDPILMANKGFYSLFETGDAFLRRFDYHTGAVEGVIHV